MYPTTVTIFLHLNMKILIIIYFKFKVTRTFHVIDLSLRTTNIAIHTMFLLIDGYYTVLNNRKDLGVLENSVPTCCWVRLLDFCILLNFNQQAFLDDQWMDLSAWVVYTWSTGFFHISIFIMFWTIRSISAGCDLKV